MPEILQGALKAHFKIKLRNQCRFLGNKKTAEAGLSSE
jgi:hypothetical protein